MPPMPPYCLHIHSEVPVHIPTDLTLNFGGQFNGKYVKYQVVNISSENEDRRELINPKKRKRFEMENSLWNIEKC